FSRFLEGRIKVDNVSTPTFEKLASLHPELEPGGLWRPTDCRARHHVAIVIPYRQREEHLKMLLNNMHAFLQRQQLDYGIYIVDQALPTRFNRAMLMNVGYAEASKQANYSCYIFHDVDLLPEDDRNLYSCPEQPRHMSVSIDKHDYRLKYFTLFGGVGAFRTEHFRLINGFSNKFFGWGGEDDDLYHR
ncbi:Beta-1,4-N-acetylgalactosaminyltransferase bre-4, partial [Lamellibrachia satsuma]